jgi:hypothetical protein
MTGVHQLDPTAVNGVMPSGGQVKRLRSIDPMVAAVAWRSMAAMVPSVGTTEPWSLPLVSNGVYCDDDCVEEPGVDGL